MLDFWGIHFRDKGEICRIFTVAFLLFLAPAGGSNPEGPIA